MYIRKRTPTDVLGDRPPLETKPLGNTKHMLECGSLLFTYMKVRQSSGKRTPRAKKMHLVGYTKSMTNRRWDPQRLQEITNSADMSFREKSARGVGHPKKGYDPFPDPGTVLSSKGRE